MDSTPVLLDIRMATQRDIIKHQSVHLGWLSTCQTGEPVNMVAETLAGTLTQAL